MRIQADFTGVSSGGVDRQLSADCQQFLSDLFPKQRLMLRDIWRRLAKTSSSNMEQVETAKQRLAAQYIRMSTDMQKYSIENQAAAIAAYAASRNIKIVRTYTDAGKSGLQMKGRPALTQLINDVRLRKVEFRLVLVYDVSRWGRFQDADESAYYEFICKGSGVFVEYCAEQFENDNSIAASLLKSIKRVMAGEYSRELSEKVIAGQRRVASKGFHVGSAPMLGLRRCLVDPEGRPKMILKKGELKGLKDHRIILVPGPPQEIALIQKIFSMVVDKKLTGRQIAKVLNDEKIPSALGGRWNDVSVYAILNNEKYAGTNVFHRYSKRLGHKRGRNPSSEWIRVPGAFEGIISPQRFSAARRQLRSNADPYSSDTLKDYLTALWCVNGKLSREVIESRRLGPSGNSYRDHFGGLVKAYREIGYRDILIEGRPENRRITQTIRSLIVQALLTRGVATHILPDGRVLVENKTLIAVFAGRRSPSSPQTHCRWRCFVEGQRKKDIVIVVRSDDEFEVRDFFILPAALIPRGYLLSMSGRTYKVLEPFCSPDLEPLFQMLELARLE